MKNSKKSWALKPKHKRKDSFANLSQFDSWWNNQINTTETYSTLRSKVRLLCKEVVSGDDIDDILFPTDKWKRFPLYY